MSVEVDGNAANIEVTGDGAQVTVEVTTGNGGAQGPPGETGPQGPAGQGVPAGGTTGQALVKSTDTDYATTWSTISGGGGQRAESIFTTTDPFTITDQSAVVSVGAAVTMPDAEDNAGQLVSISAAAQTVTITAAGTDTFFGAGATVSIALGQTAQFLSIQIGGSWGWGLSNLQKPEVADGVPVGGATGQILAKASATNYDTEWIELDIPDERAWLADALADELDTTTAPWLRCYPTAASMDGDYGGTWQITNAGNPSGTLPATPDGIDIRAKFYLHRPYEDSELAGASTDWPYQRYREILTQTKAAATGGDLTEWAVVHPDDTFTQSNLQDGVAAWFYESTLTGAAGESAGFFYDDGSRLIGVPLIARFTHDTASQTVRQWRWVPYDTGVTGIEQTGDGYWWEPVASETDARFASMDPDGTETWKIGIQNRMDVAWMTVHEYGGSKILDIQPSHIASAGVGATSFTDGVGNTISTTDGSIAIPQGLSGAKITSGLVAPARLGTGTPDAFTFLDGTGAWTADVPVYLAVKNTTASTIAKGAPVYATGSVGASGAVEIAPADADDSAKMPALGLLATQLTANGEGHVVVQGILRGVDTGSYSINAPVYVSTTAGQLTGTKPTGSSELIQNIARVVRVHASTGELLVGGALRTSDVPNAIDAGKLTSGTVATARLGTGTASASTYLRGDQTYAQPVVQAYYVAGRYYYTPGVTGGGTRSVASGVATATPYPIYQTVSVDGLQVDLSSATGASQSIDLHVMSANASGDPDASVFTVNVSTTGSGTQVLSATGTPVSLSPGLYYVVVHNRSANALTPRSAAAACHVAPMPANTSTSGNQFSGWLKSPGTGAITSYPAVTAVTDNVNQSPLVAVRFA